MLFLRSWLREKISVAMLLSGGYSQESYRLVAATVGVVEKEQGSVES